MLLQTNPISIPKLVPAGWTLFWVVQVPGLLHEVTERDRQGM